MTFKPCALLSSVHYDVLSFAKKKSQLSVNKKRKLNEPLNKQLRSRASNPNSKTRMISICKHIQRHKHREFSPLYSFTRT